MAVQIQGNSGAVAEVDGTALRALRVSLRPIDPGALGAYRVSMVTGTMAAGLAANSDIFHFRWTDATRLAIVTKLAFDGLGNAGTAFAAGVIVLRAFVSRSWTAVGSGGTPATLTGNNFKQRTSMGATLVNDIRIASTAALTAGTKTNDAQAFGQYINGMPATAGAGFGEGSLFVPDNNGYPLVLAQNEGITVQATVPATGTWTAGITCEWTEVAAY